MNQKKAKQLRRIIRKASKPDAPYRVHKRVNLNKRDSETEIKEQKGYIPTCIILGECIRKHYQKVKRGIQR